MTTDRKRLERLLGGAALAPLRANLRRRFARNRVGQSVTLARLQPSERDAVEGLLGRRARDARSLTVSIAEFDAALANAGVASGLRHALELLDGPIPDLPLERENTERAWQSVFATASETDPRLAQFLQSSAARGLCKRMGAARPEHSAQLLEASARVLARLPAQGVPRSQLAAQVLGDAHALDQGRPLATLVMAVLRGEDDETDRDTWARAGVLVNELAAPALVLNLPAEPSTAAGRLLHSARQDGLPVHLSLRSLLRAPAAFRIAEQTVYVCENANLVAIAADRLGADCAPLICTDGMPSASQRTLLHQLVAQRAKLRYHGDFDWPGLHIANFVMRTFAASPWRFCARDYEAREGKLLLGSPVNASWDPELTPAMLAGRYGLEEEAVADRLLLDLAGEAAGRAQ